MSKLCGSNIGKFPSGNNGSAAWPYLSMHNLVSEIRCEDYVRRAKRPGANWGRTPYGSQKTGLPRDTS